MAAKRRSEEAGAGSQELLLHLDGAGCVYDAHGVAQFQLLEGGSWETLAYAVEAANELHRRGLDRGQIARGELAAGHNVSCVTDSQVINGDGSRNFNML